MRPMASAARRRSTIAPVATLTGAPAAGSPRPPPPPRLRTYTAASRAYTPHHRPRHRPCRASGATPASTAASASNVLRRTSALALGERTLSCRRATLPSRESYVRVMASAQRPPRSTTAMVPMESAIHPRCHTRREGPHRRRIHTLQAWRPRSAIHRRHPHARQV